MARATLAQCADTDAPCILVIARPYHIDPGIASYSANTNEILWVAKFAARMPWANATSHNLPYLVLSGGNLSTILQDFATTGFILRSVPFGRSVRESQYRLIDEFTLFYLRWMKPPGTDEKWALSVVAAAHLPAGIAWAGYAFENTCLTHVAQIKKARGISGILTEQSAWQHRVSARDKSGAQIDLLIDRPDGVINLCEMKWTVN